MSRRPPVDEVARIVFAHEFDAEYWDLSGSEHVAWLGRLSVYHGQMADMFGLQAEYWRRKSYRTAGRAHLCYIATYVTWLLTDVQHLIAWAW